MKTAEIEFQVKLFDSKYTYRRFVGGGQDCLRYGESWRELVGDGMVLAMGFEIEELQKKLANARHAALSEDSLKLAAERCIERLYGSYKTPHDEPVRAELSKLIFDTLKG